MSYTVLITVTNPQGAGIEGAVINDMLSSVSTDQNGQANFEVVGSEDDPNPADTVQITKPNYGPETEQLGSNLGAVEVVLEPLPMSPAPGPAAQEPGAPNLTPQPATITSDNSILVSWISPQSYEKYLIWWTYEGAPSDASFPQGEVDNTGTTGSWTATPTTPGFTYTFKIEGGNRNLLGILGYNYSGWGPTASMKAVPNLTSLKQFLRASGISLPSQLKSLMLPQTSLRKFMKLS